MESPKRYFGLINSTYCVVRQDREKNHYLFESDSNDELRMLVKLNDIEKLATFGASVKNTQHKHSMEIEGKLINLTIATDNSKVNFDFNFHFNISNLTEFKEKISTNTMLDLKNVALNILKDVYNLELNK